MKGDALFRKFFTQFLLLRHQIEANSKYHLWPQKINNSGVKVSHNQQIRKEGRVLPVQLRDLYLLCKNWSILFMKFINKWNINLMEEQVTNYVLPQSFNISAARIQNFDAHFPCPTSTH